MRQVSFEIPNVAEAEPVPFGEGSMSTIAMRDGGAPSESRTGSRVKGYFRDPGGPTGSTGMVAGGGLMRGTTGASSRAEVGSRTGP